MSNSLTSDAPDQKVIYQQRCEDFRSLNGFLWQSPLLIMTLTGGLWFAVASFELSDGARSMLLRFAGTSNLLMIVALIRLRYVMQRVLTDIRAYDRKSSVGGNYYIVGVFCLLLLAAAAVSFTASWAPSTYFTKKTLTRVSL